MITKQLFQIHSSLHLIGTPGIPYNPASPSSKSQPTAVLYFESGIDDGAYYPPSDINLHGQETITKLRDALNELLK